MATIGRKTRGLAALVIATLAIPASGCVSMVGQRMTWSHDQAADRLDVLLFSDGVSVQERKTENAAAADFEELVDAALDAELVRLREAGDQRVSSPG